MDTGIRQSARDLAWAEQSDAIQNRRLSEFTQERGNKALIAMRDADIDAAAAAQRAKLTALAQQSAAQNASYTSGEIQRLASRGVADQATGSSGMNSPAYARDVDGIPTGGYSYMPLKAREPEGFIAKTADAIGQFQTTKVGQLLQGLPPEGFILGGVKAGLNILGKAEGVASGLGAVERAAVQGVNTGVPHGFAGADEFAQFGINMRAGLGRAGYENAEPILQGSAVTGKSFKTGQPFDVGRVSDFDVGLADPSMLARAKELGINLRSGGTRTGPLSERDLRALGVLDLSSRMSQQAGREVNFMIYNNPATAVQRAPSVILPGRK